MKSVWQGDMPHDGGEQSQKNLLVKSLSSSNINAQPAPISSRVRWLKMPDDPVVSLSLNNEHLQHDFKNQRSVLTHNTGLTQQTKGNVTTHY